MITKHRQGSYVSLYLSVAENKKNSKLFSRYRVNRRADRFTESFTPDDLITWFDQVIKLRCNLPFSLLELLKSLAVYNKHILTWKQILTLPNLL